MVTEMVNYRQIVEETNRAKKGPEKIIKFNSNKIINLIKVHWITRAQKWNKIPKKLIDIAP